MRETEAEPLLIKISEEIFTEGTMEETIIDNSEGAAEGVSEEEGDMVSMVELDNLNGLLSKGRSTAMHPSLLSTTKNEKTIHANLTVLSPPTDKEDEKMCCIFPGSALVLKPKTDAIQSKFIKK